MGDYDNRHITRDSLFILAELKFEGQDAEHRVKVRNLSAGGMMGEAPLKIARGAVVLINLRNAGWIEGTVAWVQDSRFGVAFREEIDPLSVRAPNGQALPDSMIVSRHWASPPPPRPTSRKII